MSDDTVCYAFNSDVCNELISLWDQIFSKELLQYSTLTSGSGDKEFGKMYHALIHSQYLEPILQLEQHYSCAMQELLEKSELSITSINERQREAMEEAVNRLGTGCGNDEQINALAQRHFENVEGLQSRWSSEVKDLQEKQRNEYKNWITKLYKSCQAGDESALIKFRQHVQCVLSPQPSVQHDHIPFINRREESFTVHLGAQLKTTHNLRIVSADVLDFCRYKQFSKNDGISSNLLQTAMSLYSNSLSGLVLLVDNRLNSYSGIKSDFARICQQSTDFHIKPLDQQINDIKLFTDLHSAWTTTSTTSDVHGDTSVHSDSRDESEGRSVKSLGLQSGDCYITKHSNLSDVHVVFHLVSDDSIKTVAEISSRHPVICGYRNVLKCCFRYDVRTITLPLLLVHEMSEEMTIAWCLKRAELVFKCIKGFIMELAMWSSQQSMTIQFLVPKSLSEETFISLSSMMPSIFRMSNPVVAKT